MVRNYARKTTRGNWTMESLHLAMVAVKSGDCSVNQAATDFEIPEATLRRYVKKDESDFPQNLGRFKPVFSIELETKLAAYLIELGKRYYGMTVLQVRKLAYEYAVKNGLKHSFDDEAKMAGVDWVGCFLKRHTEISLRVPEMTSLGRMMGFNQPQVKIFFDLLKVEMNKHQFSPSRIFNADEFDVPTVPTKVPKVLAHKGVKRVAKATSAERGKTVTIMCCMNACGNFVPPAFIFPRVRMRLDFMDDAPPESLGIAEKKGWMNQEVFVQYLKHFVKHTRPTSEDPVLLIVDNHSSRLSVEAVDYCRENHVVMLSLPPHSTHKLQPLDVTFYGPFKTYYSQACDNWTTNHPGRAITEAQVPGLVRTAYEETATHHIARKGVLVTGICPYNPEILDETDFAPSLMSDRPLDTTNGTQTTDEEVLHLPSTSASTGFNDVSISSTSRASPVTANVTCVIDPESIQQLSTTTNPNDQLVSSVVMQLPTTSASTFIDDSAVLSTLNEALSVTSETDCFNDLEPERSPTEFIFELPKVSAALNCQSVVEYVISVPDDTTASPVVECIVDGVTMLNPAQTYSIVLPEDINPFPVAERVNSLAAKRKSKAKSATLITGSPFKAQLISVKEGKALCKRQLKNKVTHNKKPSSTSQPKPKRTKKALKTNANSKNSCVNEDESNDVCEHCGYKYGDPNDPLIEDEWAKCGKCSKWCHVSCGLSRKMSFTCYKCLV